MYVLWNNFRSDMLDALNATIKYINNVQVCQNKDDDLIFRILKKIKKFY